MADTLHTVCSSGALLGVRCTVCDHRAILSAAGLPTIRRGNMTRLRDLKLRCGHCRVRGQAPEQFTALHADGGRQRAILNYRRSGWIKKIRIQTFRDRLG
jgi:hypothetical protein